MKKIGILTQPLHTNYGGILQAYATSKVLSDMGNEVTVLNRPIKEVSFIKAIYYIAVKLIKRFVLRKEVGAITSFINVNKKLSLINENTERFVNRYIPKSEDIKTIKQLKQICLTNFDAYVVGSDQCWRPKYSPCLPNYFLDFLPNSSTAKRISYAASFGVDFNEYTEEQLAVCKPLMRKFDAVSVREDSAVSLCNDYFGVDNAVHVVDPTMLLSKEDYLSLVDDKKSDGNLFAYILDRAKDKLEIIDKVKTARKLNEFFVKAKNPLTELRRDNIAECIVPPVENWIKAFRDAEFVVADSFHGCVFSIIFNKPFIAIGNKDRGLARFNSLLKMFDLEDRLILSPEELTEEKINADINWAKANNILQREKDKAIRFLRESLETES